MTPEQRKAVEDWQKAVSCPDSESANLTPQQKADRERYRAEKWPLYYARQAEVQKAGSQARFGQAVNAIHDFARQDAWFARHTPHPFKTIYWSSIPGLASACCGYLQRLALRGNQRAVVELAQLTVEMTETLTDLLTGYPDKVKHYADLMQYHAAGLPYWPMLQFRHAAANNHFPVVADMLKLGSECVITVSEQANYSLQTPINRLVWRCLRHFQHVHWNMKQAESGGEPIEKELARLPFITPDEFPIYRQSYQLPPLTRDNAAQWTDVAIMPYIRKRYPDLREVEELRYLKDKVGRTGKRYAPVRKAVLQALQQLARKP
jgi:hypothetical protein